MVSAAVGGGRASDFSESGFPRWGKPDVPARHSPERGCKNSAREQNPEQTLLDELFFWCIITK